MNRLHHRSANPLKRFLVAALGNPRSQAVAIPLFAIFLSLIATAVLFLLLGKNPFTAFVSLLQGGGLLPKAAYAAKKGMFTDFMSMLGALTPMAFASLAVAVALKTGLFNIGISGQMLVPGFLATIIVGYSELPMGVAMPLVLIIGIVGGAAVGALIGWLKHRFNINEVVSSIMLNYIISYVIGFLLNSYYIDPLSRQSRVISDAARLTLTNVELFGMKADIPLGFLLVIPVALLVRFLMNRTRLGYELKVVGLNKTAGSYAGIKVGKNVVLAMAISGALAGLAGVTYYLGYFNSIQPKVLTQVGFDSIAVCLLGNSNPIGILFSSLLVTVISEGKIYMNSVMDVPKEIVQLITGIILLFSACGAYIRHRVSLAKDELSEQSRAERGCSTKKGGEKA